ncbi:MAG: hypothetical protein KIS96_11745 [Bauldia sp.]|nr:hypothetical protein [Bauldia sp.]
MRTLLAALAAAVVLSGSPASAQTEAEMRDRLCAPFQREVRTPAGTYVDCITGLHAIEIDWTEKWAEAIGQALHYAAETGLYPGIILICRQSEGACLAHALRLESTLAYWGIAMTVWYCGIDAAKLSRCEVRKLMALASR